MLDITYLIPATGHSDSEQSRREKIANCLVPPYTTVSVRSIYSGPTVIENDADEARSVPPLLDIAQEIEPITDAIVIGCFGDPGLRPLRGIVDVPVIGPAETTLHTAMQVGHSFGWLTILEETIPMCHEQLHTLGIADRCASVRSVGAPVAEIDHTADDLVDRMIETGRDVIENDGADVLVPGCMSLAFAQRHDDVEDELVVPLLDPAAIALEQAATWARRGIKQSPVCYPSFHDESK